MALFGVRNWREMWDGVGCPLFPDRFNNHVAAAVHKPSQPYLIEYRKKPVLVSLPIWPEESSKELVDTQEKMNACKRPNLTTKPKAYQLFKYRRHFKQWLRTSDGINFVTSVLNKFEDYNVQSELTFAYYRCIHPPAELLALTQPKGPKQTSSSCPQADLCNLLWADKYHPLSRKELLGNLPHTRKFTKWLMAWTSLDLREQYILEQKANLSEEEYDDVDEDTLMELAVILVGAHGSGKTALVYTAAKDLGFKVLEMGPGTSRSGQALKWKVGEATRSQRLNGKNNTLVLLDETDNVFEDHDQGYFKVLKELTQSSRRPIVMTCNSLTPELLLLAPSCLVLEATMPEREQVALRLVCIARAEGLPVSLRHIKELVEECSGDIRAALHRLQIVLDPKQTRRKKIKHIRIEDVLPSGVASLSRLYGSLQDCRKLFKHTPASPLKPRWRNSISNDVRAVLSEIVTEIAGKETLEMDEESSEDEELVRPVPRATSTSEYLDTDFPQPLLDEYPYTQSLSQPSERSAEDQIKALDILADLTATASCADIFGTTTACMQIKGGLRHWLHPHRMTEDYKEFLDTVPELGEENSSNEISSICLELSTIRAEMCFELLSRSLGKLGKRQQESRRSVEPQPNKELLQYLATHLLGTASSARHLLDCQEFLRTIMKIEDLKKKIRGRERQWCYSRHLGLERNKFR